MGQFCCSQWWEESISLTGNQSPETLFGFIILQSQPSSLCLTPLASSYSNSTLLWPHVSSCRLFLHLLSPVFFSFDLSRLLSLCSFLVSPLAVLLVISLFLTSYTLTTLISFLLIVNLSSPFISSRHLSSFLSSYLLLSLLLSFFPDSYPFLTSPTPFPVPSRVFHSSSPLYSCLLSSSHMAFSSPHISSFHWSPLLFSLTSSFLLSTLVSSHFISSPFSCFSLPILLP